MFEVGFRVGSLLLYAITHVRAESGKTRGDRILAFVCLCDCGNFVTVRKGNLRRQTKCMDCYNKTRHWGCYSSTYKSWHAMKNRCSNPNVREYIRYGGAGISYPQEWRTFKGFLQDMGEKPDGFQLDRIDGTKSYSKDNCRWVSAKLNNQNKRNGFWWFCNGKKYGSSYDAMKAEGISEFKLRKYVDDVNNKNYYKTLKYPLSEEK